MKKLIRNTVLFTLLLVSSCNNSENESSDTAVIASIDIDKEANTSVQIGIEGMTCRMGCVSKINKTLKTLAGVTSTSIDFEEDREENFATIQFNNTVVTKDELISAIEKVDYDVSSVKEKKIPSINKIKESSNSEKKESGESEIMYSAPEKYSPPSIFDFFSLLIGN